MDITDLQRALRRKLNTEEDRKKDHIYYWATIQDRDYRVAKFSHSARGQLPDFIIENTYKRLKLNRRELENLVDCPLSSEEFLRLWSERSE